MTIRITYFVHGTTTDNEKGIATGWNPGELSERGVKQTAELMERIRGIKFDAAFCSDLKRAADTAKVMFDNPIADKRLRECNYGDLNGAPSEKIEAMMDEHIETPFPNGESYKDVENRVKSFIKDMKEDYNGKHMAIVAHRAPQLALDVLLRKKTWLQAMGEDWRLKGKWKPGWEYRL